MSENNELSKVDKIESEISIIEESHKSAILAVHENMNKLVNDCLSIVVDENDKKSYETAVELKRVVKATHVSIEKKRKELKQPLIDYGKRLDKWVEEIYNPLVNAEKIVKKKMEAYEAKQAKLKEERRIEEDKKQNEQLELENRLKDLNSTLEKINLAKTKEELKEIETYLESIVLSEFGEKSNEAGFILNQLKITCSMASRLMKEVEPIVEAPKLETTPITDGLIDSLKSATPEPVKKVIIESEVGNGLFEPNNNQQQLETPIQEPSVVGEKALETPVQEPVVVGEKALETPVQEDAPVKDSFLDELNGISNIKAFSENGSELSFDNDGKLIKESEVPVQQEAPIQQETHVVFERDANDDDVISLIDIISEDVINDVVKLIDARTESTIENKEVFEKINFNLYKDFLFKEVKTRVGVLLKK